MRTHLKVLVGFAVCSLLGGTLAGTAVAAPVMNIRILKDADFTADNGVSHGNGTKADPYVIAGLDLNSLDIENTSKYVDIHNTTIAGQLLLDWIGDHAKVHDNSIGQLVVNRNVKRTGPPTDGTIVHNHIDVVTQLRHWDGLFQYNVVGTPDKLARQGANFDGFNNAKFDHNTIYGFVDARLHGHHHSSDYGMPSHMHNGMDNMTVDHSQRYHVVSVTNNVIYTTHDYALAYLDTNHAANDRTSASETDEMLNEPHAHHTRVRFANNTLIGGGILVDVFNADDPHHTRTYQGLLELLNNKIALGKDDFFSARQLNGIEIRTAKDVKVKVMDNHITGWKPNGFLAFLEQWDTTSGIYLHEVDKGDVWLMHNVVENRTYGVRAANFTVSTKWVVSALTTKNVVQRVKADNVPRKPQTS